MGRFVNYFNLPASLNSIALPAGTTAEAPASPASGAIRFNTTLNKLEYYNGSAWVALTGGVGGIGTITVDTFTIIDEDGTGTPRHSYTPLSLTPANPENVLVFLGGIYQPPSAYSINTDSSADYIRMNVLVGGDIGSSLAVIHGFDSI